MQMTEDTTHIPTSHKVYLSSDVSCDVMSDKWPQILLYLHLVEEFNTSCSNVILQPVWKLIDHTIQVVQVNYLSIYYIWFTQLTVCYF